MNVFRLWCQQIYVFVSLLLYQSLCLIGEFNMSEKGKGIAKERKTDIDLKIGAFMLLLADHFLVFLEPK